MIRTQIYLTDHQRAELVTISKVMGKKLSELIREAVDLLIEEKSHNRREAVLREAAGMWKNHKDLPDFKSMRTGWDRQ